MSMFDELSKYKHHVAIDKFLEPGEDVTAADSGNNAVMSGNNSGTPDPRNHTYDAAKYNPPRPSRRFGATFAEWVMTHEDIFRLDQERAMREMAQARRQLMEEREERRRLIEESRRLLEQPQYAVNSNGEYIYIGSVPIPAQPEPRTPPPPAAPKPAKPLPRFGYAPRKIVD
jgi:hypothetical protein